MTLPTIHIRNAADLVDARSALNAADSFVRDYADRKSGLPGVVVYQDETGGEYVVYWTKARAVTVYVQPPKDGGE